MTRCLHPHVGKFVDAAGLATNYHEMGSGAPLVLLHGSGPGVTAWANWCEVLPGLAPRFRVLAPDIVGFGFTARPPQGGYDIKLWSNHLLGFLNVLELESVAVIGNSFGGALALATALRHPHRFTRIVVMGTPVGTFEQTSGLRSSWTYEPSLENMERVLRLFPYDANVVTPEMVQARYEVSLLYGGQEAFRRLIPHPAPEGEVTWIKGIPEEALRALERPTLVLHGREDRVVPPECALALHRNLPESELHMFGHCGHWVQLEKLEAFVRETTAFLEPCAPGRRP